MFDLIILDPSPLLSPRPSSPTSAFVAQPLRFVVVTPLLGAPPCATGCSTSSRWAAGRRLAATRGDWLNCRSCDTKIPPSLPSPSCFPNFPSSPDAPRSVGTRTRPLLRRPPVSRSIPSHSTAVPLLKLVSVRGRSSRPLLCPLPFFLVFPLVAPWTGSQPTVARERRCSAPPGAIRLGMLRLISLDIPSTYLAGPLRCCSARTTSAAPAPSSSFSLLPLPCSSARLRSLSSLLLPFRWLARLDCASQYLPSAMRRPHVVCGYRR